MNNYLFIYLLTDESTNCSSVCIHVSEYCVHILESWHYTFMPSLYKCEVLVTICFQNFSYQLIYFGQVGWVVSPLPPCCCTMVVWSRDPEGRLVPWPWDSKDGPVCCADLVEDLFVDGVVLLRITAINVTWLRTDELVQFHEKCLISLVMDDWSYNWQTTSAIHLAPLFVTTNHTITLNIQTFGWQTIWATVDWVTIKPVGWRMFRQHSIWEYRMAEHGRKGEAFALGDICRGQKFNAELIGCFLSCERQLLS